ncbi:hypothetical protein HGQ17_03320 [Nesterenkonia sp. MY13]|uniref:AtuA-like ferredoxin-fold domain-containing protein n=1 Tax=Nesterenkonia sedimenti TaxID=1463632 RepID=A0A7X8TI98_9MICC|nr:hypothetical protein [Nesterenkonia sedimenti]NLS09046.1 hypothetical protein [Nesterenkonia sedimenti]
MIVDDLADVRTGDKGDDLMIAVLPRSARAYEQLSSTLGAAEVAERYGLVPSDVSRVLLPASQSMVFHLRGLLAGGVTGSNYLDGHGKTMGYHLLSLPIEGPGS